jgi:hypothetical protein
MCYRGGPRCSKHAREKLQKATRNQRLVRAGSPYAEKRAEELKVAQQEYLLSPEGIKYLKEKAEKSGKTSDKEKAEGFAQKRKEMIEISKAATKAAKIAKENDSRKNNIQDIPPAVSTVKSNSLLQPLRGIGDRNLSAVEYDYDYTHCSDSSCGEDGDMCRDTVYEGLTIENKSVDTRAVLAEIYGTQPENISDDLVRIGNDELNLNDPGSYEAYAENGYYGEEPVVALAYPENVHNRLTEYFYSLPDAKDDKNILPYVRGKGVDTTGLAPIDAVKKSLRQENKGKLPAYVEKATKISRGAVTLSKIEVTQKKRYETVDPKVPNSPKGADKILGVVMKRGDKFVLVDGYQRVKHANLSNSKSGTFLILY